MYSASPNQGTLECSVWQNLVSHPPAHSHALLSGKRISSKHLKSTRRLSWTSLMQIAQVM